MQWTKPFNSCTAFGCQVYRNVDFTTGFPTVEPSCYKFPLSQLFQFHLVEKNK